MSFSSFFCYGFCMFALQSSLSYQLPLYFPLLLYHHNLFLPALTGPRHHCIYCNNIVYITHLSNAINVPVKFLSP